MPTINVDTLMKDFLSRNGNFYSSVIIIDMNLIELKTPIIRFLIYMDLITDVYNHTSIYTAYLFCGDSC